MSSRAEHPIVVFGDDWNRHVSSLQHVFREIVEQRPVIWVNGIGHRIPALRGEDLRRAWEKGLAMFGLTDVDANGSLDGRQPDVIVHPRVLPWHHRRVVQLINRRSLERSIRAALASLDVGRPPILVTGSPPSAGVVGRLGELAAIYFCMDDFSHLAGVSSRMLATAERELLNLVDATVATARSLTRSKVPRSGEVHYLPQGVNYRHFAARRERPPDLEGLPRPWIGFAGGVSDCCDFSLIQRLAERYAEGTVLLVGPVTADTAGLDLPNIHMIGARPYRDLPAYVQHFDVGIIPYVLNEWTRAVDPLKLLEYLAAGIPVVSTAIPEVNKYGEVIGIAGDRESFLNEVERALSENDAPSRHERQAVARENAWTERARELLDILDTIIERRSRAVALT